MLVVRLHDALGIAALLAVVHFPALVSVWRFEQVACFPALITSIFPALRGSCMFSRIFFPRLALAAHAFPRLELAFCFFALVNGCFLPEVNRGFSHNFLGYLFTVGTVGAFMLRTGCLA